MTKEELIKENTVVHCSSEQEIREVANLLKMATITALDGWYQCKENTCLNPSTSNYSRRAWYESEGMKVITAKEFIEANTEPLIQVGTVVKWNYNDTESYEVIAIDDMGNIDLEGKNSSAIYKATNTMEQFKNMLENNTIRIHSQPNKTNMTTQTISREGMKEIYDVACSTWQDKIKALTLKHACPFSNNIDLPQAVVDEMFKAASGTQIVVLKKYFKQVETFNCKMLKAGEVMRVDKIVDGSTASAMTTHILRSYDRFIGFDSMGKYTTSWTTDSNYTGTKMASGSEFTLTVK